MAVLGLTILISTLLALFFSMCFWLDRRNARQSSPERDALMPLADDDSEALKPEDSDTKR